LQCLIYQPKKIKNSERVEKNFLGERKGLLVVVKKGEERGGGQS